MAVCLFLIQNGKGLSLNFYNCYMMGERPPKYELQMLPYQFTVTFKVQTLRAFKLSQFKAIVSSLSVKNWGYSSYVTLSEWRRLAVIPSQFPFSGRLPAVMASSQDGFCESLFIHNSISEELTFWSVAGGSSCLGETYLGGIWLQGLVNNWAY